MRILADDVDDLEPVGVRTRQLRDEAVVVAVCVDEAHRPGAPHAKLPRASHLPKLIPRSRTTRQGDEAIGAFDQPSLAFRQTIALGLDKLEAIEEGRDGTIDEHLVAHTAHPPACSLARLVQRTHHTLCAGTVDAQVAALRQGCAERACRCLVRLRRAARGGTVNAHTQRHRSGEERRVGSAGRSLRRHAAASYHPRLIHVRGQQLAW